MITAILLQAVNRNSNGALPQVELAVVFHPQFALQGRRNLLHLPQVQVGLALFHLDLALCDRGIAGVIGGVKHHVQLGNWEPGCHILVAAGVNHNMEQALLGDIHRHNALVDLLTVRFGYGNDFLTIINYSTVVMGPLAGIETNAKADLHHSIGGLSLLTVADGVMLLGGGVMYFPYSVFLENYLGHQPMMVQIESSTLLFCLPIEHIFGKIALYRSAVQIEQPSVEGKFPVGRVNFKAVHRNRL